MKALSLYQPWATLCVIGAKKIETRSWQTDYRGPLAIHASKTFDKECQRISTQEPFISALGKQDLWPLPIGCVVGTVQLVDCVEITRTNAPAYPEYAFGNYEPGRYAWKLDTPVFFNKPVPYRGAQGLWEWNPDPTDRSALLEEIAAKAGEVLNLQQAYFRSRTVTDLTASKSAEADLRNLINRLNTRKTTVQEAFI